MPAAKKYGVQGYPTILFVDGDGNVVVRTAGFEPPADFSAMMGRVLDLKHIPEWEAALKADPNNADTISKLGMAAALKTDTQGAVGYAQQAMALAQSKGISNANFADLYNAVGDMFQNANAPDKALPYFEDAANSGAPTNKVAYALISEGYCYLMTNKAQQALDAANRAAALTGLSKDDATTVANIKAAAVKMLSGKG